MKTPFTLPIFVVAADARYGELLAHKLELNPDYTVSRFAADAEWPANPVPAPELIVLELAGKAADGRILQQLRARWPAAALVLISGRPEDSTALQRFSSGGYEYLAKNENTLERVWQLALQVSQQVRLRRENERQRQQISLRYESQHTILGEHASMQQLHKLIAKAASASITVSISGETGTGKELVAKAIHFNSKRAGQPFVAVNMAAIPRELLESELFGHEKGAFTGAVARRVGRFEEANGGTIFLDEVADLELGLQAQLLRVLQEREVTRVGGTQRVAFDVRLIVATHRDLTQEVAAGRFREDLYYRLLGLPIELPPLRERGDDVLLLADAFLRDFCLQNSLPLRQLTICAQKVLRDHPFPGNVRELKAVVELAAVLAEDNLIRPQDLTLRAPAPAPAARAPDRSLRQQTLDIIQVCLDEAKGDVVLAAQRLSIGKSTIYRLLQTQHVHLP